MNDHQDALVCFAMKGEARPFERIAAGRSGASVLVVGVGPANAERSIREHLSHHSPRLVLTCGFAGGLHPGLALADVVFDTSSEELRCRLLANGEKPAKFFCSNRVATTVAEKARLRDESGADAVEMESAAIHAVCLERNIPCATVRIISDTAHDDLPLDFNRISKPDYSLDFGKLIRELARSPGQIGALLRFQRSSSRAAEKLARAVENIVFLGARCRDQS